VVYTDKIHLVADSEEELHVFAKRIGLKRTWFQDHKRHPHYDLTTKRATERAIRAGATVFSKRIILLKSMEMVRKGKIMKVGKFEKEYPMLFDLIKGMEVCHGAYNKDWLYEVKEFEVPENWKEKLKEGEELAEKYSGVTFGSVWSDAFEDLETIDPETGVLDYIVFPEQDDWSTFLKERPEFKPLDDIMYEAFEGVLDGILVLKIPKGITPQKEQEKTLKAAGFWKGENDEKKRKMGHSLSPKT